MVKISRIDTKHQLRAFMSALHIKESIESGENLVSNELHRHQHHLVDWIALEKDGQPPSIIVVADLLEYLVQDDNEKDRILPCDGRYSTIR